MRQEVDEHLKRLAPELDRRPRVVQLLARGIKHIVAKAAAHRLPLAPSEPSVPPYRSWATPPRGAPTPSAPAAPARIIAQSTPQNTPKIPRNCPERVMCSCPAG